MDTCPSKNKKSPFSSSQQKHVDDMAESIRRSWKQVKQMEADEIPVKSAMSFIDEL